MTADDTTDAVIVSVPADSVDELEHDGLAAALPTVRGPFFDAVIEVGLNAATLVTLMQTPSAKRDFAAWVRGRAAGSGETIELKARRGGKKVTLRVDGDVPFDVVADFIRDALEDPEAPAPPALGGSDGPAD